MSIDSSKKKKKKKSYFHHHFAREVIPRDDIKYTYDNPVDTMTKTLMITKSNHRLDLVDTPH